MAHARKKQKLVNGSAAITETCENVQANSTTEAHQTDKPEQPKKTLFVRSLPSTATSESLTDLFSDSYPVKHAIAVTDPATKQCRGYGFVTFADAEDAKRARDEFNGHTLEGKKLRIELAEARHRGSGKDNESQPGETKPPKKQQDIPQPSRLIVRNLPWTIKTPDQLSKLFMSYGKVMQAYIPKKGPGLMAGFGFVVLRGRKNAEKALESVNGKEVDGRTLAVDWAVSKEVYDDLLKRGGEAGEDREDQSSSKTLTERRTKGGDELHSEDDEDESDDGNANESEEQEEGGESEGDEDTESEINDDIREANAKSEDRSTTVFVRNLPFTCTDEDLDDHFSRFGGVRYARVVLDQGTERPKGTGFVCFYSKEDADTCVRGAPRRPATSAADDSKDRKASQMPNSILQNEQSDPSGEYTMDGRVLQVSRAVDKSEADRLTQESAAHRYKRNEDKRRLYLLSEGTVSSKSKLWEKLSPSERTMRDASAKQRRMLIESNPSLHLSLTRLSIRNIPRFVDSKELKSLAREAVVGFASDVKAGSREKLSKEELARGGDEMQEAERARKKSGKGVVKQAKVVFEGAGGSKVSEDTGAGRSRGYGFIEYYTHRSALMGLRWLNGHAVGYKVKSDASVEANKDEIQDRKKRLIVEFAIENAQVVMRRRDREQKAKIRVDSSGQGTEHSGPIGKGLSIGQDHGTPGSRKRKRSAEQPRKSSPQQQQPGANKPKSPKSKSHSGMKASAPPKKQVDEKVAKRNQIIGRKRAMRKARRTSKH
jgi:nucleolar protein 4